MSTKTEGCLRGEDYFHRFSMAVLIFHLRLFVKKKREGGSQRHRKGQKSMKSRSSGSIRQGLGIYKVGSYLRNEDYFHRFPRDSEFISFSFLSCSDHL